MKSTNNTLQRPELLSLVNDAQNELFGVNMSISRTKPDPNLVTIDQQFSYTLAPGIRTVRMAYTKVDDNVDYGGTPETRNNLHDEGKDDAGNNIFRYAITIKNAINSLDTVRVIFPDERNPGDTTIDIFLEQYIWPEQLTSELIPLSIPDSHVMKALRSRTVMLAFEDDFGDSGRWEQLYEKDLSDWLIYGNDAQVLGNNQIEPWYV